jgi:hypothetical protein
VTPAGTDLPREAAELLPQPAVEGRAGLLREDRDPEMRHTAERRIVIAQSLYFVGVLLGFWNTYVGIGFIVLLQLNSAIAPKIYPLDKF